MFTFLGQLLHLKKKIKILDFIHMLAHCVKIHTVSAFMLPRGYIFQYGFLGGGQFKKSPKTWTFSAKSEGLFKKNSKN